MPKVVDREGGSGVTVAEFPAREARTGARLHQLVHWLDELVRVPGTDIHIGLDPIIGFLLPGVGDAITGTGSAALLVSALRRGVPTVVLLRMLLHIAIDASLGSVPIIGDLFDVLYRSNRKNLDLLERHAGERGAQPRASDYALVSLGLAVIGLSVAVPFFVGFWLVRALGQ